MHSDDVKVKFSVDARKPVVFILELTPSKCSFRSC